MLFCLMEKIPNIRLIGKIKSKGNEAAILKEIVNGFQKKSIYVKIQHWIRII